MAHPALAGLEFHLDRTPQQFAYDLAIVAVVLANVLAGARHGLIRRVVGLAGVYGGAAAATYVGRSLVRTATGDNTLYADAWGFVIIFAGVVGLVELLGLLYRDQISKSSALAFDRIAGALAGIVVGVAEVAVLVLVVLAVGNAQPRVGRDVPLTHSQLSNDVRTSTLGGLFAQASPGLSTVLSPVLPSDFSDHLSTR
ncbi:MAG: CvpA family protein [Candidatus Dormibacteria bacterium]